MRKRRTGLGWISSALSVALGMGWLLVGCGDPASRTKSSPPSVGKPTPVTSTIDPVYGHLTYAQPKLPTIKVWLGPEELTAELALRPLEIATGMMFRTNMLEHEAMLFVFPDAGPRSFYMRNCTVPLTAAYINPEGVIEEFAKLDPGDTNGVMSKSWNIQYVLELPQGWPERHHIRTGAVVRTERGSLRETFFKR
jgi:hypothetical protein